MRNRGRPRLVAVLATLDTKGEEAAFLRERLGGWGLDARLVDVGVLAEASVPLGGRDVPRREVAAAAGVSVEALPSLRRDRAMAAMGQGAARILQGWHAEGRLAGAIGIGGNQGTAIAAMAMRPLPLGLPRVLVSTVASGDLRPYIGSADIAVLFSVGDFVGGLNPLIRGVLARAAGMLAGMVEASQEPLALVSSERPVVALTVLGNTHPAAVRILRELRQRGYEVVPFHASGAGGSAMEQLMRRGAFAGVVDLTTHELLGAVLGDDIYAPVEPGRLMVAGELGLPQVVAPGSLEYFVFGPESSVPPRYRGRAIHHHNPYNTNVRATPEELARAGEELARRLNAARGPVAFLDPLRGWSQIGSPGGPLWNPEGHAAFRAAFLGALDGSRVRYEVLDVAINDPAFADRVVETFVALHEEALGRR